jgi:hypothetical protein
MIEKAVRGSQGQDHGTKAKERKDPAPADAPLKKEKKRKTHQDTARNDEDCKERPA